MRTPTGTAVNRRVVVTGVGLVTPLGIGVDQSWSALIAGQSGIGPITRFDPHLHKTRIAGEVKDFHPADFLPRKDAKRVQLFIAYAAAAARMAVEDSGLDIGVDNADRVGVITGCGLGGLGILEDTVRRIEHRGPGRVSPFFIPMLIGNMAPGMISIYQGAKGPNASLATACAAGTHAVGQAVEAIRNGWADAMITGGVESVITPTCIAGFNAMHALSVRNETPQTASRPFDRDRDGFVVGEGAGMLVIETLAAARRRGARIYAEISGFGMSGDGFHMTSPAEDGEGMARCMQAALDDAGLAPTAIDHVNAHGTATELNDVNETRALKTVFGDHAHRLAISATKSMTGHLLGGGGGVEAVFTALSLFHGIVPPTINLDQPDPHCDLDYVARVARRMPIRAAVTNSFGFGGTNASLVLRRTDNDPSAAD